MYKGITIIKTKKPIKILAGIPTKKTFICGTVLEIIPIIKSVIKSTPTIGAAICKAIINILEVKAIRPSTSCALKL